MGVWEGDGRIVGGLWRDCVRGGLWEDWEDCGRIADGLWDDCGRIVGGLWRDCGVIVEGL